MGWLTLSGTRAQQLRHFRRRTWALIALCFFARGADATLGLGFIEHAPPAAAQGTAVCRAANEMLS
jgi:hypothetical protein